MEEITQSDFVQLAVFGFSVGFGLGFLLWAVSYAVRLFRNSVSSSLRVFDRV